MCRWVPTKDRCEVTVAEKQADIKVTNSLVILDNIPANRTNGMAVVVFMVGKVVKEDVLQLFVEVFSLGVNLPLQDIHLFLDILKHLLKIRDLMTCLFSFFFHPFEFCM